VLTVVDPREKTTSLAYDTNGNLSERADANHNEATFTYDARDRLTGVNDALGHATLYEYDAVGRIKKITHPDLSFITFTYDLAGRRTVVTDERGNSTNFGYDGANRLTSVTDAANHVTTYGYNSMSRLISVTDALARVTNYDYDDFNRLVKTTFPAATAGATRLFETIGYDAAGNITQRSDTAGRVTSYTYDNTNRLTSTTDAANKTTSFGYDALSRTTSVTDALNQQYQFAYDALGRPTQITRGGVSMSYQYDAAGNRTQRTDYNGAVTGYEYDNLNRLTTITYPDFTTVDYGYDEVSRLTAATNANGTVTLTYDNRNRATSVAGIFGQTVNYGYDVAGNRTSMAIGGSNYASYSYDAINRLNSITDGASLAINYGYDATNKLTSRTLPNGITSTYDYDGLNRLTRLRHTTATATLTDDQYSYDTANRISQLTDLGGTHAYSYDSVDRLTSATYPGATSESYTYDGVGNRTASHLSASYTYQPFNKVTSAGGVTYTYDNNGNLLTKVAGTATTQYAWDFENHLTQVTLPNGTVVNYKYDALGRRIQRNTSTGDDERYVYDGQNIVQDLNSSSSVVASYLSGPGFDNHVRQTNATTGVSYFLTDQLGSTVGLTDSSANLVEQISYDSFGNHVASSRTRYTYTGRERDADTGLMYYRARFYDPQTGRFISEDPLGFGGGDINLYGYVWQSPLRFRDPLGLDGGLAPSDIADVADKGLQTIQGYLLALNPDAVDRNTIINFVANNLYGMHDLLRVGRGVGSYLFDDCGNGFDVLKDVGRASTIALMLAGPAKGLAGALEAPGTAAAPRGSGYMPFDPEGNPIPLPKQNVGGVDIPTPLPEAEGPHTSLGTRMGDNGIPYRQSAEFPGSSWPKANGQDVPLSEVNWTHHGRPWDHPSPHQHIFSLTGPGGTWQRGPQAPYWRIWWP
jgi:RHS repeat-associated protein